MDGGAVKIFKMIVVLFVLYIVAFLFLFRSEETNTILRKPAQNIVDASISAQNEESLSIAQRQANDKNFYERQRLQQFLAEGWVFAETHPPDARVQTLDPNFLNELKVEYQTQMSTNTFSGKMLNSVYHIAVVADDSRTRAVAIENLGRSSDVYAQELLINLYQNEKMQNYRADILQQILPKKDHPQSIQFLIGLANGQNAEESLRLQALSSLVIAVAVDLRDSNFESHTIFRSLSSDNQVLFRKKYAQMMGH